MSNSVHCLLFVLALLTAVPAFATTYVAVVETAAENGVIGRSERMFLTDKLRERAKKVLPEYMGYVIMTRENIQQMLPPGKKIEDCEGECLVETGKNINAHYIAQARVGKFGKQLTLTVELYETRGNNLVGSFTAMSEDALQLLKEIERQADGMFATIAGGNFGLYTGGGADGFEGVNMGGSGYKASGAKSYIVSINSNPAGAVFSVDGRPDADCNRTPCDITLKEGDHRISFGLKMYFEKDTVVDVLQPGQKLIAKLNPNFGELTLKPQLQRGVGSASDLGFIIDGNKVAGEKFRLAPGRHSVTISHECYEMASFNVNINIGSDLVFDKPLAARTGGLQLDMVEKGKPKALPVFVNGTRMGETPFLETVSVCSKVEIGDGREQVPVKLKANETVAYKYELGTSSSFTDSRDGQTYRAVKMGKQTWMAQNLNYKTNDSYCYNDKEGMCKKFGRLYKWNAAKNACPSGWHLPSDKEWDTLWNTVGGINFAGTKLKSKSMKGSDSFDFAVLPSGYRMYGGSFTNKGEEARFWNSSVFSRDQAHYWGFFNNSSNVYRSYGDKDIGLSVRCLKNSN